MYGYELWLKFKDGDAGIQTDNQTDIDIDR